MEAPILQLKDVAVYQNNNLILSNINLAIGKGELVYLIGKTGSVALLNYYTVIYL